MLFSLTLFRLLCSLAAGGLACLAIVPARTVSRGFFRFTAGVFAGLLAAGLLVRPEVVPAVVSSARRLLAGGLPGPEAACLAFALACVLAALPAALAARLGSRGSRLALRGAAVLGLLAVAVDGLRVGGVSMGWQGPASSLLSAMVTGSAIASMTLGHWYLVLPKLSPAPLLRLTWAYALSIGLRAALVFWVLAQLYLYGGHGFDRFFEVSGLLVWPRLLFGLVAPLVLALMALPAVRARDTQPATGMLYVACVLVLIGEGLGLYLRQATGVPV